MAQQALPVFGVGVSGCIAVGVGVAVVGAAVVGIAVVGAAVDGIAVGVPGDSGWDPVV